MASSTGEAPPQLSILRIKRKRTQQPTPLDALGQSTPTHRGLDRGSARGSPSSEMRTQSSNSSNNPAQSAGNPPPPLPPRRNRLTRIEVSVTALRPNLPRANLTRPAQEYSSLPRQFRSIPSRLRQRLAASGSVLSVARPGSRTDSSSFTCATGSHTIIPGPSATRIGEIRIVIVVEECQFGCRSERLCLLLSRSQDFCLELP